MSIKILHIAPQNFAGMPLDFVKMHRGSGCESRLVTLYKNTINFDEDICLNFKLPSGRKAKSWRDSKITKRPAELKYNQPENIPEKIFFKIRDELHSPAIKNIIRKYDLFSYDIYHFDGGMDFYRDLRFVRELKKRKKKIVCCYYGSDLRTRGIFKELDEMSDLNLTVEFDHLSLHKEINYIYFPFDTREFEIKKKNNKKIKIIHSPTNRRFKGTDKILKVISDIEKQRQIEFILVENMDRSKVLELKSESDLAIDQVGGVLGGTGYGKNSIENLSMGVPTFTEFTPDYLEFIKENPFIHSTIDTLGANILKLIDNENLRTDIEVKGRDWVEKYHSYGSVNEMLQRLYLKNKIL